MNCYLICTMNGDFYPVERIADEGGAMQSIDRHAVLFGEPHREHVRLIFPSDPRFGLSDDESFLLGREAAGPDGPERRIARQILDEYEAVAR